MTNLDMRSTADYHHHHPEPVLKGASKPKKP